MEETLTRFKEEYADPDALRRHLAAYLAQAGMSQDKAGKEIGISTSALNQFLQGKYKGDNEVVAEKVLRWLASRERKTSAAAPFVDSGYTETETSKKIMSVLTFSQSVADFCVVYGGAGVGKTTVAKHYRSMNPNVWLATMAPDCSTVPAVLDEVSIAFGISNDKCVASSRLRREIVKKMRGTGGLLIVDEAQCLNTSGIEIIRSLYDGAEAECGVVLCGNESVYSKITGGVRAASFAQIFSRVGKRLKLTKPTSLDVEAIANQYGITGQKELAILKGIGEKPGALRGLVKTLRLAAMFAESGTPSHEHIAAAWRDLSGEA